MVGAVLVRDGRVVAEGFHAAYGQAHAEVAAMADARARGVDLAACTLVVTLEPCNHQGRTPPCTRAVLDAGIRRVVIGSRDPNPDVAGCGAEVLRAAGIEVVLGVEEQLCRDLIADFLVWKTTPRPYVLLKMAATLDGRTATRVGHSRWISSEASRAQVHWLRSRAGAVMVGGGTLRADDPRLTARLHGREREGRQPLAVAVSGGMVSSTFLTLLVVPIIYSYLDQLAHWRWVERFKTRVMARDQEAEA